jgi:hypothetical protein
MINALRRFQEIRLIDVRHELLRITIGGGNHERCAWIMIRCFFCRGRSFPGRPAENYGGTTCRPGEHPGPELTYEGKMAGASEKILKLYKLSKASRLPAITQLGHFFSRKTKVY